MEIKSEPNLDDFSLTKSGVFYKLLLRVGLADSTGKGYLKRSLFLSGVTWLPLLLLSTLQGLVLKTKADTLFLYDFAAHARFLLIIPLLVFAEGAVDYRLRLQTSQFFKAGIINKRDIPQFQEIKKSIEHLSESVFPDVLILLLIVVNILFRGLGRATTFGSWVFLNGDLSGSISWAGIWLAFFSLPIFQFILFRWLWRWIIWIIYFTKISGMPLKLNPAHPDLAGGIGFLGMPPGPFLQVNLALSFLFSTAISVQIVFQHQHLRDYYVIIGGFALFSIIMNVLPLLVFVKQLSAQRRKGILEYSALIQKHHKDFDDKWLRADQKESLLGEPDASSMIDINSSFDTVMSMKIFPFNLKIMLSSIIVSVLPLVPLFAFEYNLIDIMKSVIKMLA